MSATPPASGRARVPGSRPAGPGRTAPAGTYGRVRHPDPDDRQPYGDEPPATGGPRRGRPRWRRIALVTAVTLLALAVVATGGAYWYVKDLDRNMARTDPYARITGDRPPPATAGAVNILLVGTDSRDPDAPGDRAGKWRADTLIVMHMPADRSRAYLVSIPRDLYVNVPRNAEGTHGGYQTKINAAFAWGGLPLAVQAVEGYTGVRMDHVMVIDFGGFQEVTDALGGVDLYIEKTITSIHKPHRTFQKGMRHLDGAEALDYVRQRYQFADGDFSRMRHQQQFLKAVMDRAASTGTLTNPAKLNAFLQAVTSAVTVDRDFSLVDMAFQFRGLRGDDLTFMTTPTRGTATIDGQSVVLSDKERASALFEAMHEDTMAAWVKANPTPSVRPGG